MNAREVRELVRLGRAVKTSNYRAGRRGLSFIQVLTALERCYAVEQDARVDPEGHRLHPKGWFALANLPARVKLRIDFDVAEDELGNLLLIVTAYEV